MAKLTQCIQTGVGALVLVCLSSAVSFQNIRDFELLGLKAQASHDDYGSPFQRNKVQLSNLVESFGFSSGSAKAQSFRLPAGTELVLTVDTECAGTAYYQDEQGKALLKVEARPLKLLVEKSLNQLTQEWMRNPCVIGVSENVEITTAQSQPSIPSDPFQDQQHHLDKVNWKKALQLFYGSSLKITAPVLVAIVDSGVEYDHEDLQSQIWRGPSGERGVNLVDNTSDPRDDNGHGTHVSGILGADSDNAVGVSGVMTGPLQILPVKVLDSLGNGSLAAAATGIRYAADRGADIINLSLGTPTSSATLEDAVRYAVSKGSFVVMASGNDGFQITSSNFYSPVGYAPSIAGAIGVGSVDALSGRRSLFSNYSSVYVDLAAPGSAGVSRIYSTWIGNTYKGDQGTSMAAPVVSGAAALVIGFLKTHQYEYTPALIEEVLLNSARLNPDLADYFVQGRELDLLYLKRYLEASYVFQGRGGFEE